MPRPLERSPTTFEELAEVIASRLPELTPARRSMAERVLHDPETVAFMSIHELADAANVNAATVTRFATSLGLSGYPALTRLCQDQLRAGAQLVRRFRALDANATPPERAASDWDRANIEQTFARVAERDWSRAGQALADAPSVHVLGLRKSQAVSTLLGYQLRMLREDVHLVPSFAYGLAEDLRRVKAGDAFVAVSIHRYAYDTVRGIELARAARAFTIAITDQGSPLTPHADVAFICDTSSPSLMRSVTAMISVAQALVAIVARSGTPREALIARQEDLLETFRAYELPPAPPSNGAAGHGG